MYFNIRAEAEHQCLLVIIGVREDGTKELVAIDDGVRESEQSWTELLVRLRDRQRLGEAPRLVIGDGGLGLWKAMTKVFGATRHQRCWVHKTANVLNKLPKSLQKKAKGDLQAIWMAPTKAEAERAFDAFLAAYGGKYPKATECLAKDRESLLTFYDFPAAHRKEPGLRLPGDDPSASV